MIDWQQFHFLRPAGFALLLPLALLFWYLLRRQGSSRGWEAVCDPALLPHVLIGEQSARQRQSLWPVALAGILATLALAGPTWSRLPQPVFSSTQALVIVLDLSRSMNATDVAPSRIERARFKIADLLRLRRDGQAALIVYAGDAFTVAPLTDDAATLLSQLPALTPAIMPVPGNRAAAALARARDLLRQAGLGRGDVLLITDEVEGDAAMNAAAGLHGEGYRVSVLGVGTAQGAPVPLPDGSFLKDDKGEIVIPALVDGPLRQLAAAGGGIYQRLAVDDADINALSALLDQRPSQAETRATELQADIWRDQGPWLVLALLPLAALAFRRGLVLALVLTVLPVPRPAEAMEWSDLWLRADQQGKQALDKGDSARAAELFQDPRWRGAAKYKAGDFQGAAEALEKHTDAEDLYNRGNALARMGKYPEALTAYDQALALRPDHEDAKFNRDLVRKQMQTPPPQSRQQDGKQGDNNKESSGQGGGDKDASGKDQSGKDQSGAQPSQAGEQSPAQQGAASSPGSAANDSGKDQAGATTSEAPQPAQGDKDQQGTGRLEDMNNAGKSALGAQPDQKAQEKSPAQQMAGQPSDAPVNEDQQAMEQWLRRIPDDPGGLLRRKFQYQYQVRRAQLGAVTSGDKTW
jgi:Ca-activated chloride channel family protein